MPPAQVICTKQTALWMPGEGTEGPREGLSRCLTQGHKASFFTTLSRI